MPDRTITTHRWILILGCWLTPFAFADVLHDHDNGPLTGIFGIPDSTEGGYLLASGAHTWGLAITSANHSIDESRPAEMLFLDGETTRFEFRLRYAVSDNIELGLEVPYLQHEPGRLDSFIDSWHQWFGLPEGLRPARERDVLDFRYTDGAGNSIDFADKASGIGDLRLFGGWRLFESERHAAALRLGIKFPTGDSDRLLGSGGYDLSLGLAGDLNSLFGYAKLSGFYRVHAVSIGEPDILTSRSRDWVGYVSAGVGYRLSDRLELQLQGASRSALYDSDVRSLGGNSTTVTIGGNIRIGDNYELSLGVGEDIDVSTAPDVAFQIALRYRGPR